MSTRIDLQKPDGTMVRPIIVGPESAMPLATGVPAESWYFAEDTGTLSFSDGLIWHPAVDTRPVSDGTTTTIGVVELRTDPVSGTAIAYTEDDLGATDGVVPLDSAGLIPSTNLPKASRIQLGGVKNGGSGITIAVDGTTDAASAGTGSFAVYHNGVLVSLESILDLLDSASVTFTVTDNSGAGRVEVQTTSAPVAAVLSTALGSGTHNYASGAWGTVLGLALTQGTWLVLAVGSTGNISSPANFFPVAEFRFHDGASAWGVNELSFGGSSYAYNMAMVSDPVVVGAGGVTINWQIQPQSGGIWRMVSSVPNDGTLCATRLIAMRIKRT